MQGFALVLSLMYLSPAFGDAAGFSAPTPAVAAKPSVQFQLSPGEVSSLSILTIVGVAEVRRQISEAAAQGHPLSARDQGKRIEAIADALGGGGQFWSAMVAAGYGGKLAAQAAEPFVKKIGIFGAPKILASVLRQEIAGSVSYGAAIAATEAWSDGVRGLSTEDRDKGQNLILALDASLKKPTPKERRAEIADQARIFGQILWNIGQLPLDKLAYDSWRHQFATGTVANSGALIAAGTAVAGPVGFLGGAVVSVVLPNSVNDFTDHQITKRRFAVEQVRAQACYQTLRKKVRSVENSYSAPGQVHDIPQITHQLEACEKIRDNAMTIVMDHLFADYARYKVDQDEVQHQKPGTHSGFEKALASDLDRLSKMETQALSFYSDRIEELTDLRDRVHGPEVKTKLSQEVVRLTRVQDVLKKTFADIPGHDDQILRVINASADAFDEGAWLPDVPDTVPGVAAAPMPVASSIGEAAPALEQK